MTQEIVNRSTGELVSHQGRAFAIEGSMPLGIDDLRPPILKIVQGQTRNVDPKKIGQYHFSLDGSYHEEFPVVFVGLTNKSRAFRKKIEAGGSLDDPPLCASDDAIMPRSHEQAAVLSAGPSCGQCPFSRFGANGEAPPCAEQWNFLGLTYEEEPIPFLFRVQGLAIRAAKQFIQPFYWKKRALFTALTTMSTTLKAGNQGSAYIPSFFTVPLPPGGEEQFEAVARSLAGWQAQADVEPEEATQAAPTHNPVMSAEDLDGLLTTMEADGNESDLEQGELLPGTDQQSYDQFKQKLGPIDPVDAPRTARGRR